MLKTERNYDFKTELLQIHKKDLRQENSMPGENEFALV